jgi:hypothetical protein
LAAPSSPANRRADALLSPVALAGVALLLLNDHVLKHAYPGWVTGKLSDVAGLVFFPLFLVAIWELVARRDPTTRALAVACATTAVVFALVKLGPLAGVYRYGLAAAQWPFRALLTLSLPRLAPVALVQDPTDLLALPALIVPWLVGRRRVRAR